MSYTYLMLNILSISIPLIKSFDKRISYARKWLYLFPALLVTGTFFLVWDVIFTEIGVWGFNDTYLIGERFLGLPLEEWLFFFTIPYASIFIYEAVYYYVKKDIFGGLIAEVFSLVLVGILLVLAGMHLTHLYTSTTFILTALFILAHLFWFKTSYLGRFYLSYAIILIPFFMVNGVLTGCCTAEPVVWYNDAENMGIRMGSIPVEDSIYGLLLILMNITIYEYLMPKKFREN